MRLSVIAAVDRNGLIGNDRGIPWHLPRDLRRFRELTLGKAVVMGRTTHEHVGRPLPGRLNVVLSRRPGATFPGCAAANLFEEALQIAGAATDEVFVIGGGEVYREAIPRADRMYLTVVDGAFEGTARFPCEMVRPGEWVVTRREACAADAKNAYRHLFLVLERAGSTAPPGPAFDLRSTLQAPFADPAPAEARL